MKYNIKKLKFNFSNFLDTLELPFLVMLAFNYRFTR